MYPFYIDRLVERVIDRKSPLDLFEGTRSTESTANKEVKRVYRRYYRHVEMSSSRKDTNNRIVDQPAFVTVIVTQTFLDTLPY